MEKVLEKYKHKYPNSVKYIEDNLTDLRCFRCGSPLLKELESEEYPYLFKIACHKRNLCYHRLLLHRQDI